MLHVFERWIHIMPIFITLRNDLEKPYGNHGYILNDKYIFLFHILVIHIEIFSKHYSYFLHKLLPRY